MPALVKSKFGGVGSKLAEGTMVCCFPRKKPKNDCLSSDAFMIKRPGAEPRRSAKKGGGSSASCKQVTSLNLSANGEPRNLPADVWELFERVVDLDFVIPDQITPDVALDRWPAKDLSNVRLRGDTLEKGLQSTPLFVFGPNRVNIDWC